MRKRNKISKIKIIGLMIGGILLSPVVASGVVKGLTDLEAAASILSDITVGGEKEKGTGKITDYRVNMMSSGFGWLDETAGRVIKTAGNKGPIPYPELTDVKSGNVIPQTYGYCSGKQFFDLDRYGQVRNCTDESMNVLLAQSRLRPEFSVKLNSEPQVLIMHTHTTESFEPFEREYYDSSFSYRSSDESMNVVAIGEEIRVEIEKHGIAVIHDTTIHDYPSYNGSYERSAETVREILSENSQIKVVLDIHRDAIASGNDLIAPVVDVSGKKAAQIMIISGCDDGTMDMPNYLKNFRLACMFQQQIEEDTPGITRPILFDYRGYNQNITTGSLLIEVGSHGNSIDQVKYSGKLIGNSIGKSLQSLT